MNNKVKAFKFLSNHLDNLICLECVEIITTDRFKFKLVHVFNDVEKEHFCIIDLKDKLLKIDNNVFKIDR